MDKKHKIAVSITIGVMCYILFSIMFMQFKTVENTNITSIQNMREAELKTEMTTWKNKYDEIAKKLEETTITLNEYKTNEESNQQSTETLREELQKTNMLLRKNKFKRYRNNYYIKRPNN